MDENKILKRNTLRTLLLFAFALSGLTCFIYEVVWIRPLQLIFGSTIYAVSTMLTTFMVGFVLGAFLFRNLADRSKNPAILFAGLEFGIGLYGLVILSLFKILPPIYLSLLGVSGFQFLQFGLAFLVLILPATLFGATWPVVNKAYVDLAAMGKDIGRLYSFNSLGGVFGSLGAGFLLIPLLGIQTALFAASLNILIAFIIFIYVKQNKE
jgi:predicted membrane-bound spermidine synthase